MSLPLDPIATVTSFIGGGEVFGFTSPTWISTTYILALLSIWCLVQVSGLVLSKTASHAWESLGAASRVTVSYDVTMVIGLLSALGIQLYSIRVLAHGYTPTASESRNARVTVSLVCLLYCAEILYKRTIPRYVLVQRVLLLLVVMLSIFSYERLQSPDVSRMMLGTLFQSTAESLTLAATTGHRMYPSSPHAKRVLAVSAVATPVAKLASTFYVFSIWINFVIPLGFSGGFIVFDIIYPIAMVLLFVTDFLISRVLLNVSKGTPSTDRVYVLGTESSSTPRSGSYEIPTLPLTIRPPAPPRRNSADSVRDVYDKLYIGESRVSSTLTAMHSPRSERTATPALRKSSSMELLRTGAT